MNEIQKNGEAFIYLNINNLCIAWEVYRGFLISATSNPRGQQPISWMYLGIIESQNNSRLFNEILIERIRSKFHPSQISRLQGIYFFNELEIARKAIEWGGHFQVDNLVEVKIFPEDQITKVDCDWITHATVNSEGKLDHKDCEWIHEYWSGKPYSKNPKWEFITNGRAVVYGTSVRKKAYETVKRQKEESLPLLELSRVAADLGFDVGHIIPWIQKVAERKFKLSYIVNMEDAKNKDFLEKLRSYEGPKNTLDLNPQSQLITPNLSDRFFEFEVLEEVKDNIPFLTIKSVEYR